MKIQSTILLAFLLSFSMSWAQQPNPNGTKIKFEETTHDFGNVKRGDPTEHTFSFTNVSDEEITLKRVKASCGCTTPSWTRDPIAPGETGDIAVKYNSYRVGRFTKSITVTYDSVERPIILYIKGMVETPPPSDEEVYKVPQGGLSFDKVMYNIGSINTDQTREFSFMVKNNSPKPITFQDQVDGPEFLTTVVKSASLLPGEKTEITVTFDGSSIQETKAINEKVTLHTDDAGGEAKVLTIAGRVNKVYSQEELDALPRIEFVQTEYKGQTVIEGEKLTVNYQFKNTGGSDLVIESVRASCGCTATSPKDKVVPAGGSSEITATFDSRGRIGKQRKTITVRSNDPKNPNMILRLEADVERDPFHIRNEGPVPTQGSGGY
jgi:hypothetical protein